MSSVSRLLFWFVVGLVAPVLIFFIVEGVAGASPFLVCDPQTNVTSYVVTLDGTETEVPAQDLGNGTVRLHFDLAGVTEGEHHVEVRAKNIWGVSDPVPFDFTKALPVVPSGFSISEE